jgi:type IV pilus assembly protein PilV
MLTRPLPAAARGSSLIEALVAIAVLAIGLLGMAKLQVGSRQYEMESYQRAQAMILLQDMVARLNANRGAADCYAITTDNTTGAPFFGQGYSGAPTCSTGTSAQQTTAVADMNEWNGLLLGSSEKAGATDVGAMIGARGCVYFDAANNFYVVTVAWQGLMETAAPSGLSCGKDQYGGSAKEGQRRAVSAVVQFGILT